jgi:hypothetical protein
MAMSWVRTSHELEGHGNSVLIVGHFCGVVIRCRGELSGDGREESWSRRRQQKSVSSSVVLTQSWHGPQLSVCIPPADLC